MSTSNEAILEAIKTEAIDRMSAAELAERAAALRAPLHNILEIEPIDVRGGTLYTVTSGIVTNETSYVQTSVEDDQIVRRHIIPGMLTLFADVVEFPRHNNRWHQARLFHVEEPLEPTLAEARGALRPTLLAALEPGPSNYSPPIYFGSRHISYHTSGAIQTDEGTLLNARAHEAIPLRGGPESALSTHIVATSEMDHEIGVRTALTGRVTTDLEPFQFALVTDKGVRAGPESAETLQLTLADDASQNVRNGTYKRIPDDVKISLDEAGKVVMTGGRADNPKYEYVDLQPYLDGAEVSRLLPPETMQSWPDVTQTFIKRLSDRLAQVLPLNTATSWEQTVVRAREQVRDALLAERTPIIGGVGNLAVAARMAELPPFPGDYRPIDKRYFTSII